MFNKFNNEEEIKNDPLMIKILEKSKREIKIFNDHIKIQP